MPANSFSSVYGPVESWRYGKSLGIDPIGAVSTCSFDCVYCQLGAIQQKQSQRQVFVPTSQIQADLTTYAPWSVDVITLSGSGEPTLALNLGEILAKTKQLTEQKVGVLTNATLLGDPQVQQELAIADFVAVKVDAASEAMLQRVNRPVAGLTLQKIWEGIQQFRSVYSGQLDVQTMILHPWDEAEQAQYLAFLATLQPREVQLNVPSRPRPRQHELEARSNQSSQLEQDDWIRFKLVEPEIIKAMGDRIPVETGISVRYAPAIQSLCLRAQILTQ